MAVHRESLTWRVCTGQHDLTAQLQVTLDAMGVPDPQLAQARDRELEA